MGQLDGENEINLESLMKNIEVNVGVPYGAQKILVAGNTVPRSDPKAPLESLGIADGTQLLLVHIRVPTGSWSGIYDHGPFEYTCRFDCDRWEWHDKEVGNVQFEMEWRI